jgi:hypothetical protein
MINKWAVGPLVALLLMLTDAQDRIPEMPGGGPATLVLHIVDSFGNPVEYSVESFHNVNKPAVELAGQFQGLTFKGAVRLATYEFRLVPRSTPKQFPAFTGQVFVGEPLTFAVFSVPGSGYLPDGDRPWPRTSFVVSPAPRGNGPVWATVRPAFVPEAYDSGFQTAIVSRDGAFSLPGLHGGRYIITVAQDSQIPKLAVVDIPLLAPSAPIEVHVR